MDLTEAVKNRIADRVMNEPLGFVRLFRAEAGDTYVRSVLVPDDTLILNKDFDSFWAGRGYQMSLPVDTEAVVLSTLASLAEKAEPGNIGALFRYCLVVADDFDDVLSELVNILVKHDVEVLLYSYLSRSPNSLAFKHGRYLENVAREMEYIQGRGIVYGDYMPEWPGVGEVHPAVVLPPCMNCGKSDDTAEYQVHYAREFGVAHGLVLCSDCHIGPKGVHDTALTSV